MNTQLFHDMAASEEASGYPENARALRAVPDVVAALRDCERELMQMRIEDAARWTMDYKEQLRFAESGYIIMKARAALASMDATEYHDGEQ